VKPEEVGFAKVADRRYPLLLEAAKNARPAISFKVEWLVDTPSRESWVNYTQILRTSFTVGPDDDYDRERYYALERHLAEVEQTLWDGVPAYEVGDSCPRTGCGGVRHFLGREPLNGDRVALRIMRDLALYKDRDIGSSFTRMHEYISEFSLQVDPAYPLALPRAA
jgi:hypothetical protein